MTTRHESRWFLNQPDFAVLLVDVCGHQEPTHVSLSHLHRRVVEQLLHTRQRPLPSFPWMLVHEVPPLLQLVSVESTAEFNMLYGFSLLDIELVEPSRLITMCCLVQFLKYTEVRTWR